MRKNMMGFTLVELMVVMSIIAVLITMIVGAIRIARRTATETVNRSNARTVQLAYEAYFTRHKFYPNTGSFESCAFPITLACWNTMYKNPLNNAVNTGLWMSNDVKLSDYGAKIDMSTCPDNPPGSPGAGGGTVTSTPTRYIIVPYQSDCSTPLWEDRLVYPD